MTKIYLGAGVTFALALAASAANAQDVQQPTGRARDPNVAPSVYIPGEQDALGRPQFRRLNTQEAIDALDREIGPNAALDATRLNRHMCGAISVYRVAILDHDRMTTEQANDVEEFDERRQGREGTNNVLLAGSAAVTFLVKNADPAWWVLNLLGLARENNNQQNFNEGMDIFVGGQNLNTAAQQVFNSGSMLTWQGLARWCPAFERWDRQVNGNHGYYVDPTNVTMNYTPAEGVTPAAGPESW